jgi:hypothetical protein
MTSTSQGSNRGSEPRRGVVRRPCDVTDVGFGALTLDPRKYSRLCE